MTPILFTKVNVTYLGTLEGHNGWITSLQAGKTKEGKTLLLSGGRDKSILIWELGLENEAGKLIERDEKTKEIKEPIIGKPKKSLHGHNHFISSLALSSDSKKLISGSWDKTARLWDIPTYTSQNILAQHTKDVLTVGFSQNERVIFTGSMDKTLKYWNTQGEMKFSNSSFRGWITCMVNFNRGKEQFMAVGCMDGDVRILDHEFSIIRIIEGGDYGVTSLSASDEGDFLFVAYKNGTVKLFSLATSNEEKDQEKQVIESNVDINTIAFESKQFAIIALGTSTGLQILNVKDKKSIYENEFIKSPCISLCYDQTKEYLFAGHADGKIRVYKINTNQ